MASSARRVARPLNRLSAERHYQERVKERLEAIYPGEEVAAQWYPFIGEERNMYWPVVDIAVGPFAKFEKRGPRYTAMMNQTRLFIQSLIEVHNQNVQALDGQANFHMLVHFNENARCLFCIEVEQSGSKKHCLGNLVNASALGRIGLLVAMRDSVLRTFVRQRAYLKFLADVEKNTFKTANALILTAAQFDECLARGNRRD
jgi:hypothetical protein